MITRFTHSLFTWTCLLILGAASFLRPGMVLCISEHGHVRLETNCATSCETMCADSCDEQESQALAAATGTNDDCRDVPLELDPTSLTRADKGVAQFAAQTDVPVAILEVPFALMPGSASATAANDDKPRPPAALRRLRVIVLQV